MSVFITFAIVLFGLAVIGGVTALQVKRHGRQILPWTKEARNLQTRVEFLRRLDGAGWPDLSDATLYATLEEWLPPYLSGITRRAHF